MRNRREAPPRKPSQPIAGPQVLGRLSKSPSEPGVGDPHLGTNPLAGGVDERRGRLLGLRRLSGRMLPENRGSAGIGASLTRGRFEGFYPAEIENFGE